MLCVHMYTVWYSLKLDSLPMSCGSGDDGAGTMGFIPASLEPGSMEDMNMWHSSQKV